MPYALRKPEYHIEDFASFVPANNDWSYALNAAIAQIKADNLAWAAAEGTPAIRPAGKIKLGNRHYKLVSAVTTIDFPLLIEGIGYGLSGTTDWSLPGSWLQIHGSSLATRFFFAVGSAGSKFDKLGFIQDQTRPVAAATSWTPTNYDWVIQLMNGADDVTIGDIGLMGINRFMFGNGAQRVNIENVRGQVFREFIWLDMMLDVCHWGKIHLWPYWSKDWRVLQFQQANMKGAILLRTDGIICNHFFVFAAAVGIELPASPNGATTGLHVNYFYADLTKYGLIFGLQGKPEAHFGTFIAQGAEVLPGPTGNFTAGTSYMSDYSSGIVMNSDWGHIQIGNLRLDRHSAHSVHFQGAPGAQNNTIDCGNSRFYLFDGRNLGMNPVQNDQLGSSFRQGIPAWTFHQTTPPS